MVTAIKEMMMMMTIKDEFYFYYRGNSFQMEALLEMMQDPMSGIVVKTVKSFISKIPSVFTGGWLHGQ